MEDLLPTEFYLSQNHPNPFKGKTIIKYCLPEEIRIKLEIFDSRQEKIKTLVDEIKEPGTYQAEFNPNGFGEGIYLYQLSAGSLILTKKMILLK
jgi:hypothetical protein